MYELKEDYAKGEEITKSLDAKHHLDFIRNKDRECFVVLYLNARKKLISKEIVSIGTLSSAIIHPREIYKTAIIKSAAAIILAHNHPSGNPEPSDEDIKVTSQLQKAGEILDIHLLDHIIVSKNSVYSMSENHHSI